ncbi:MAG TPA: Holliday junction resolvase [Candidatus Woesearchaeota archaeon]|nr:Holliday junction resolvase [Candidatus Woesearchaeota archaeon]
MHKQKGSNAERELIRLFWNSGWAAHRIAGSGSSKFPSPDIIAGNFRKKLAIECKSTKSSNQYVSKEQANALNNFASIFGAEPWIGVRFDREDWYFVPLKEMRQTASENLVLNKEKAKLLGLKFEDLVR